MAQRIWLRVPAICALTGYGTDKILNDAWRSKWPWKQHHNSTVRMFALDIIEDAYGISVNIENVIAVANKLNRVSVWFEEEETTP